LNMDSPDVSATLNERAMETIPINNRRWSSLAMTTPGIVADTSGFGLISVRGISTILNNVEIDGADDNQAYYAEERGRTREAYSTSGQRGPRVRGQHRRLLCRVWPRRRRCGHIRHQERLQ
jgi:hypothetical protein